MSQAMVMNLICDNRPDALRTLSHVRVDLGLEDLLTETGLVLRHSSFEQIRQRIALRKSQGLPVSILYGETYDTLGNTIDSIKYYLYVGRVAAVLAAQYNCAVQPNILVADIAACRNFPEDTHKQLMKIGQERYEFVRRVNSTYGMNLNAVLMSQFLETDPFQHRFGDISEHCLGNPELEQWLERTIPESKVEIERANKFRYAVEEIATIIEIDIKIGPPREQFYDEPARMLAERLGYDPPLAIYLTPTYPLGLQFDYFLANPEVEEYGITAYKAGSKGVEDHRIIIGKTSVEVMNKLIDESFLPSYHGLPNPVLDMAILAEMAHQWLDGYLAAVNLASKFYSGALSEARLRDMTKRNLHEYVIGPLNSGSTTLVGGGS